MRKPSGAIIPLLLFGIAFAYLSTYPIQDLSIYQARDIHRAWGWLRGEWTWYGPDLSAGGTTPGPFYYWLLAVPLAIFQKWQSLIGLEVALASAAATGLWVYGSRRFSPQCGWLMYFLFLHSSVIKSNLSAFWNPSFIHVFQVLALILLFDFKSPRKLAAGAFLLGISVQVHYTQLAFFFGLVISILTRPKIVARERARSLLIAIGFFALPLVPYLLWRLTDPVAGYSTHSSFLGLKGWLFYAAPSLSVKLSWGDWLSILAKPVHAQLGELMRFASLPLCVSLGVTIAALAAFKGQKVEWPKSRFLWSSLIVSATFLGSAATSGSPRYALPFAFLFLVITACVGAQLWKRFSQTFDRGLIALAGGYVVVVLFVSRQRFFAFPSTQVLVLVLLSGAFMLVLRGASRPVVGALLLSTITSAQANLTDIRLIGRKPEDRIALSRAVIQATGWTYDHFRERAYLIGFGMESDLSVSYEQVFRQIGAEVPHSFDGVLISREAPDWNRIRSRIPGELFEAAASGRLSCARNEWVGGFHACFYRFTSRPQVWNNLGHAYRRGEPERFTIVSGSGVQTLSSDHAVLFYNPCENLEPSCTLYFDIRVASGKLLTMRAYGDPIGTPSFATSPSWVASLRNPKLRVACGQDVREYRITYQLGAPESEEPNRIEPFLLAPLETHFKMACAIPDRIEVSGAGYFEGLIPRNNLRAHPFHLEWQLGSR